MLSRTPITARPPQIETIRDDLAYSVLVQLSARGEIGREEMHQLEESVRNGALPIRTVSTIDPRGRRVRETNLDQIFRYFLLSSSEKITEETGLSEAQAAAIWAAVALIKQVILKPRRQPLETPASVTTTEWQRRRHNQRLS